MSRLSAHFRSEEFDCHDGTPVPEHALDDLVVLCRRHLEPLRAAYGPVRIVSGYRTRSYNREVGGAPASFHIYLRRRRGVAADVIAARAGPSAWATELLATDPGGLGVYADHVHVDTRSGHARW